MGVRGVYAVEKNTTRADTGKTPSIVLSFILKREKNQIENHTIVPGRLLGIKAERSAKRRYTTVINGRVSHNGISRGLP